MMGLRPVVAVYSTFLSRAFDQANLDVGLHGLPVVFAVDRAGITGDDGPSHHGVLDLALTLAIPGMTVFAPSSAQELPVMLRTEEGGACLSFTDKEHRERVRLAFDENGPLFEVRNAQGKLIFQLSEAKDGSGQLCVSV